MTAPKDDLMHDARMRFQAAAAERAIETFNEMLGDVGQAPITERERLLLRVVASLIAGVAAP